MVEVIGDSIEERSFIVKATGIQQSAEVITSRYARLWRSRGLTAWPARLVIARNGRFGRLC